MAPKLVLFGTSLVWVVLNLLESVELMVGAGLKGCATGLFVCPLGFGPVFKAVGRLGLLAGCGLGVLDRTGLEETG